MNTWHSLIPFRYHSSLLSSSSSSSCCVSHCLTDAATADAGGKTRTTIALLIQDRETEKEEEEQHQLQQQTVNHDDYDVVSLKNFSFISIPTILPVSQSGDSTPESSRVSLPLCDCQYQHQAHQHHQQQLQYQETSRQLELWRHLDL